VLAGTTLLACVALILPFATGDSLATRAHMNDSAEPGEPLWVSQYDGPEESYDSAAALSVRPDGSSVFVTGMSDGGGATNLDYATVAYSGASGAQLWASRYNGSANGNDIAKALGVAPDGSTVFTTGSSYGGAATGDDYSTVAYDAATGHELWAARYNGAGNGYDVANAVGVAPDGSTVFTTGSSNGGAATGNDYSTVAHDAATGVELWAAQYDGPANGYDVATALSVSPDSSTLFVTGYSSAENLRFDYATVAYDAATGHELWASLYDGPGSSFDSAVALAIRPDGSAVFVTGSSPGSGTIGYDYATVAYDAVTGVEVWAARYNAPQTGSDSAYGLAVGPDGSTVFVTGSSYSFATATDITTVAYDASSGTEQWASRSHDIGNDVGVALGVSPTGSAVYVTGSRQTELDGRTDYATIAYET
jgi:hypothetical protein